MKKSETRKIIALESFVPRKLLELKPDIHFDSFAGAFMVTDISGFTRMSEALTKIGREGAEELTKMINFYFVSLIDNIYEHGGYIYRFGGDAIYAVFEDKKGTAKQDALNSAGSIQKFIKKHPTIKTSQGMAFGISVHISITYGKLFFQDLNNDFFIGGKVGFHAMNILEHAKAGDIVCDSSFGSVKSAVFEKIKPNAYLLKKIKIAEKASGEKIPKSSRDPEPYLPEWLRERIDLKPLFNEKDGEHKKVAIGFIHINGIDFDKNLQKAGERLFSLHEYIQGILKDFGGWINKIDLYKDSIRYVILFGFPFSHEDDEVRSVIAALKILKSNKLKNVGVKIGLNTGLAFGVPVGSDRRREYTVMGDTVNLAARIAAAVPYNSMWVSKTLKEKTERVIEYGKKAEKSFKGKKDKHIIFEAVSQQAEGSRESLISEWVSQSDKLVGRDKEIKTFLKSRDMAKDGKTRIFGVMGEAGVGKSRFSEEIFKLTKEDFSTYLGSCISYGTSLSYYPFIEIINKIADIQREDTQDKKKEKISALMKKVNKKYTDFLPILGEVLGLDFKETEISKYLDSKMKKENFFMMVGDMMKYIASKKPTMIVFEDIHWIDSLSLELLQYLTRNIKDKKLLFLILFRPIEKKYEFMEYDNFVLIHLKELSKEDTIELVYNLLSVKKMSDEIKNLIVTKSQGNPFYVEEIIKSMVEQKIILKEGKHYTFNEKIKKINIPDNVEGVIVGRIDRLDLKERDVLQTASVLGREFDEDILRGIYKNNDILDNSLSVLYKLDLIRLDESSKRPKYFFKHILTKEVAYDTMSFQKKRELHEMAGSFIEKKYKAGIEEFFGILSYHYYEAKKYEKAMVFSVKAGEKAKNVYANYEAIDFFTRAIESYKELERISKKK